MNVESMFPPTFSFPGVQTVDIILFPRGRRTLNILCLKSMTQNFSLPFMSEAFLSPVLTLFCRSMSQCYRRIVLHSKINKGGDYTRETPVEDT